MANSTALLRLLGRLYSASNFAQLRASLCRDSPAAQSVSFFNQESFLWKFMVRNWDLIRHPDHV